MMKMKLFAPLLAAIGLLTAFAAPAQQAKETKEAAAAPASTPMSKEAYIIGPEDVLEIDLLGQADFRTRAKVKTDGTLPLPFLGTVKVSGQNAIQLAANIAKMLRDGGYYSQPIINVEIVGYASRYVIVLGEVANPGLQPVDREYRVSEIVARAGGLRQSGADYVQLTRTDGTELKLPFKKLASGSDADDPMVRPGDKLFVPEAESYYIYGQINAPGAFPYREKMSIRMVIARSGGLTPSGSEKRIKLFNNGKEQKIDLERIVQPGDVIVVGERFF